MDEGLFKGQRVDNNEWVFGDLIHTMTDSGEIIIQIHDMGMFFPVIKETVCKYTGLIDENGVRIFDGDIIKFNSPMFDGNNKGVDRIGHVYYSEKSICNMVKYSSYSAFFYDLYNIRVIGNKHDKLELVEEKIIGYKNKYVSKRLAPLIRFLAIDVKKVYCELRTEDDVYIEYVVVVFKNGGQKEIFVRTESLIALTRDVLKLIDEA